MRVSKNGCLRTLFILLTIGLLGFFDSISSATSTPNVLFIAIDDLNDYVGCLGGHPQALTPNIDRLAEKGVLFENAHCAAPLCNPSRTAIMTGLRPSTTGIYCNRGWFREHPSYANWQTIPQYFASNGYTTWTGGKIYHQAGGKMSDPIAWNHQYSTSVGTTFPPKNQRYLHGLQGKFTDTEYFNTGVDWFGLKQPKEKMPDWKNAELAAEFLDREHEKPFFLACGIFRPHLPWYAPKEFFDMHPLKEVQLPAYLENDTDDLPLMGKQLAKKDFAVIREAGQWQAGVQGYLACTTFADACVGHLLDALEKSRYADNTIVVLWGDHGWHLGEKDHWSKFALWDQTSRTPLVIYNPQDPAKVKSCKRVVSLLDIYPTLIELCGLLPRNDLDGRSLAKLVHDPQIPWDHPALITHWRNNHAVQDEQYRYIRYRDGGEELYDHQADPNEWKNLAGDPAYDKVIARLAKSLPTTNAEHFQPEADSAF